MSKYTEEEILCLFREAKDKQEEILILVDLTLRDENEIRKIVGVSPVENPKKPMYYSEEAAWRIINGYLECDSTEEYAKSLGLKQDALYHIIDKFRRNGYAFANRKRGRRKTKNEKSF